MICVSWRLPPLTAIFVTLEIFFFLERNSGSDFSKAAMYERMKKYLLNDGFFSFAVMRQIFLNV